MFSEKPFPETLPETRLALGFRRRAPYMYIPLAETLSILAFYGYIYEIYTRNYTPGVTGYLL